MKRRAELSEWAVVAGILLALLPGEAAAYIGPGGGLSLLSTALAMLAAFSVSAVVVVTWPVRVVRRWLQRRRERQQPEEPSSDEPPEEKR